MSFIFQNRQFHTEDVPVEFPDWFATGDAHALWLAVNQAREGAAGSAAVTFIELLIKYHDKGFTAGQVQNMTQWAASEFEQKDTSPIVHVPEQQLTPNGPTHGGFTIDPNVPNGIGYLFDQAALANAIDPPIDPPIDPEGPEGPTGKAAEAHMDGDDRRRWYPVPRPALGTIESESLLGMLKHRFPNRAADKPEWSRADLINELTTRTFDAHPGKS